MRPISRATAIARSACSMHSSTLSRVARALDRDPAVAGARADALERALGAREPAARGRGAPGDVVLVRDPDGDARGAVAAPVAHVALERALARGDRLVHAAEEPQRLPRPSCASGDSSMASAASNAARAASHRAASSAAGRRGADRRRRPGPSARSSQTVRRPFGALRGHPPNAARAASIRARPSCRERWTSANSTSPRSRSSSARLARW